MARKNGTIKSFIPLWLEHEKLYCSIFLEALQQLEINAEQRSDEDAISEVLCLILNEVCFRHERDVMPPVWEQPKQPVHAEELKGGKIRKRPDFTCNLLNSFAESPEARVIALHVECKRLGQKADSWDLNKNYVTNGIKRFDSSNHEYGKRAPSGMMLGYIINMEQTAILSAVNKHLSEDIPKLSLTFTQKVVSCEQNLTRKYVGPAKFKLIHIWTDLR